jgi:NAD(P)-dependent dehydrogenase (short-subunit alcohol dehydrogenase family)
MHLQPSDTAVVTGAGSGIGLALTRQLLDRGLDVVLADVEEAPLRAAATTLAGAHPGRVLAVRTDVSRAEDVDALRDAAVDRFGRVDLLCNNAGVTGAGGPAWELDARDWQWALGVNVGGVAHGIRAFVPGMVERGHGHVLNTASLSGLLAPPFTAPYNATKHAVVALSETLAAELAIVGADVGVSVACPGLVTSAIWEAERNRPAELRHGPPPVHPAYEAFREVFAGIAGEPMDTAVAAARMLAGVEAGRLHVLTHPHMNGHVRDRLTQLETALAEVEAPPLQRSASW